FTFTPVNGDAVYCIMAPNAPCVTGLLFNSNVVTMTVTNPPVNPLLVTVSTKTAIPGQKVYFPVKLKGASASGAPISSANIQITYDPAVLQYDTLINFYSGTPSAQWYFSGNLNTVAANWIEPSLLTLPIPDSTTLFDIRFTYLGGNASLPFMVNEFTDAQYNFIPTNHLNGGISSVTPLAGYLACDFHQHSTYTDGSYSFGYVMQKDNTYGLSWWANSEHGGGFTLDGGKSGLDLGTSVYFDSYSPNPIIGTVSMSGGHQNMWRWQSLRDYAFQNTQTARATYSSKMILQSYELNVPGHEHAGLGIINNQFSANANCNPLAEFEFKFDASDADVTGGVAQGWTKSALGNVHAKAVEAVTWLHNNYPSTSYLITAHAERKSLNNIQSFRDMNNAGPDVCFGFESMPGHQKATDRGEYKTSYNTFGISTYGGTGIYSAQIGGLWDAMLSEGRHWWLFASSDFHSADADFYPGEYQKTYAYVSDRTNPQSYIDALRSGNSFVVEGDLIDSLDFKVGETPSMPVFATIGQTFTTTQTSVVVKIKVRDPQGTNYNTYSAYTNPSVDHVDLIKGKVTGLVAPGSPNYTVATVPTTSVIARFDATGGITSPNGVVSQAWTDLGGGIKEITYTYNNLVDSVYFRLRGTNLGLNVANETDANGNPLSDALMAPNNASKAFADLWFYSNPIFVAGPVSPELSGPSTVCQGSAGNVYTTDAGKTNYNWSVTGGSITAAGTSTDNTATVTWNNAGAQSISVSYTGSVTTTLPVTVNPSLPVSVTIAASANPVCLNTSVTFTATPVNGGSTPVYQWKKNGSNVGTNNPVYTYAPVNNDVITCALTSNA
ncbi:MAG: cohesin domain-containing protein, partial [Bacteroidota bacterium]